MYFLLVRSVISWVINRWCHGNRSVVYGPELSCPFRWWKHKQTAKNDTFYPNGSHHPLITQLNLNLKARFLKQNYFAKVKKLQELWSFLHFRWLHFCHPLFSRLSTYSWPPRLRHRIYELSICKFHSYNHWMWHLQGQKE